jgi:hypothetical protein
MSKVEKLEKKGDLEEKVTDTIKGYQEELAKVQERKNQAMVELENLNRTEQRLFGAIAGISDLLKSEKEEENKGAEA